MRKLEIEIRHVGTGHTRGSLPWLLAHAGHMEIGLSQGNQQTAWLMDRAGKLLCTLAVRNYGDDANPPDGHIVRASNPTGPVHECDEDLYAEVTFTSAAWAVVEKLQDAAVEEMDRYLEEEDSSVGEVLVETRRRQDPVAVQLARDAVTDPKVLPILRDRLAE